MKKVLPFALFFLFSATAFSAPTTDRQRTYDKDFETVWKASIEMLTLEGFPIKTLEKENGLIHSDFISATNGMFKARYSISFFITQQEENKTRVVLTLHYETYFPSRVGSLHPGEWIVNNDKDKRLVPKYFSKLDSLLV